MRTEAHRFDIAWAMRHRNDQFKLRPYSDGNWLNHIE